MDKLYIEEETNSLLKYRFIIGAIVSSPLFIIYFNGLQRTVWWGDPAEFIIASYTLGIPHPTGYPIYTWLGKLFTFLPTGQIAFRVNLMSAVFAYFALVCLFLLTTELLKEKSSELVVIVAGGLSVSLLGFSRPFWEHAEIAETYAINTFFVFLWIYLFVRWLDTDRNRYLYLASLVLGISLGTHLSNVFMLPIVLAVALLAGMRTIRKFLLSAACFTIGASQYFYLFFRAMQSPTYHHGQARFFSSSIWNYTGPDFPILKWFWFITGGRWKGAYTKSLSEVSSKVSEIYELLVANYGVASLALFFLGIIVSIYARKEKGKLKSLLIIGVLLFEFLYYLVYGPSNAGMILPFFGYFTLLVTMGIVLTYSLIKTSLPIKTKRIPVGVLLILIIGGFLLQPLLAKPWIDYSNRNEPEILVSKMKNYLPLDSMVVNARFRYRNVFRYYRLVEGAKFHFSLTSSKKPCKSGTIKKDRCFGFEKNLNLKKHDPDIYKIPYLKAGSETLYKLTGEVNTPEIIKLKSENPSPPIGAIKITKVQGSKYKIEVGQIGWERGDPKRGENQGMKYKLTIKAKNLQNINFQEWPPDKTEVGYVIEGGVWRLGADSLYAYGLREIGLTLTQREGNFAPDFNAYYVDLVSNPIEFNTMVSDVTTARLKKESWRVTESSSGG